MTRHDNQPSRNQTVQRKLVRAVLGILGLSCIAAAGAQAQSGGPYDLKWSTIDGGGATSSVGGGYSLGGTIGQHDAGMVGGGVYILLGGFWSAGATVTGVGDDDGQLPEVTVPLVFKLYPNSPNPFNPRTTITFDIPRAGRVRLAIYDVRGALVRTLVETSLPAGHHAATWDGTDISGASVASGTYIYTIDADGYRAHQKSVLLR